MNITLLNLMVLIFGIFAISRAILRFNSKELSFREMVFWLMIWTTILVIVFFPAITTDVAKTIGVGRGADSAFFAAIILLFYLSFRLYVKIDKVDKELTSLAINTSRELHKINQPK